MRDLHLSKSEIDNLSYGQIWLFLECLKEVNKLTEAEYNKAKRVMGKR